MKTISAQKLHSLLLRDTEHALVDVREIDPFSQNHLLFAVPLPYSRLELLVTDLLPRLSVPMVICDGGEGLAERAALRLLALGYTDVAVLEGAIGAWQSAGYETYSGVNVPSKAFGEFVEHESGTPSLSADEVHQMMENGEDMIVLDSRPYAEFQWASIPTGLCCSGAELVYRGFSAVPSTETKVVVNCAGRTRSIIGAQSLINAGLPNNVYALRNGIMGWRLSGYEPAKGEKKWATAPDDNGRARSKAAAEKVASRFKVHEITPQELKTWRDERTSRSLFMLDVRTIEEFENGHLNDAVHAPGGQVIQATDEYIGVRNARIVLIDNDGIRSAMTASWLNQMGQKDVRILQLNDSTEALVSGSRRATVAGLTEANCTSVSPEEAKHKQQQGAIVLDVSLSTAYRAAHIPGAWFILRSQLSESLSALPDANEYIISSEDGSMAKHCAVELDALVGKSVSILDGGNTGWKGHGFDLVPDDANFAVEPIDIWRIPFLANKAKGETVEDAMRAYLDWEVDLMTQLARDGTTHFRQFPKEKGE